MVCPGKKDFIVLSRSIHIPVVGAITAAKLRNTQTQIEVKQQLLISMSYALMILAAVCLPS